MFRDPALRPHSYEINKIVTRLFRPGVSNVEKYEIEQQFQVSLKNATNAFYRIYPPESRLSPTPILTRRINAAEQYLQELERTVSSFAEVDTSYAVERPSFFDHYPAEERNAATLIQYMMRYGVEFGKAKAGTEIVYDRLFIQFRDLARQLNAAPGRESIAGAIIDLDFDGLMRDESDE